MSNQPTQQQPASPTAAETKQQFGQGGKVSPPCFDAEGTNVTNPNIQTGAKARSWGAPRPL